MAVYLAIALGGFIGAPARYLVDRAVTQRFGAPIPWGTVVINVTGSLLLGVLAGLGLTHHLTGLDDALIGTGFCGAYTTFSTFTFETVRLVEIGDLRRAAGNVVVSVAVGLACAAAGLGLGLAI
jgi:CrcB protein